MRRAFARWLHSHELIKVYSLYGSLYKPPLSAPRHNLLMYYVGLANKSNKSRLEQITQLAVDLQPEQEVIRSCC